MDDLVVIILTILIAVVGGLSQRKKRREMQNANSTQTQPSQPMDFWDLLREQSTGQHPFEEAEPMVEMAKEEPVDTVPAPKPVYQFSAAVEGSSDIMESSIKGPKKKRQKVLIEGEKFSLRKAIIYSEIMNRKYT